MIALQRKRLAVLISGRGSNMAALIDAASDPAYPAEIVAVVSDQPGALGLERAQASGIAAFEVDRKGYADRAAFEAALQEVLSEAGVELIALAGFMRLLSADFVERWRDRIMNIHPSLLPAFKGLDTHARALTAGVRVAGCTVHVVRADMDAGPIIAQAAVPVLANDTEEALAARVLAAEHRLYPFALARYASGVCYVDGERVVFRDGADAMSSDILISPAP
jgi:phosphoribosylglycinamide formyltransferase-1